MIGPRQNMSRTPMRHGFRHPTGCTLGTEQSGAVTILFAIMAIVLLGMAGVAIDYARASRTSTQIQTALDAANLAAAKAASEYAALHPDLSAAEVSTYAEAIGQKFIEANLGAPDDVGFTFDLTVRREAGEWLAQTSYHAQSASTLLSIMGRDSTIISGTSEAGIKPGIAVLDIAMCIDSTGSMTPTLDAVKANATTFYDRLNSELTARGIPPFAQVRVRLSFFKDYGDATPGVWDPDPMRSSAFFKLPDQTSDFESFAAPQVAYGGWDWAEGDIVCLNDAMDSRWMKPGDILPGTGGDRVTDVFPLIVVWTDSPAHGIDFANSLANPDYPAPGVMPRTYADFLAKWNNSEVIDQKNKQILFFGDPYLTDINEPSAWLTIKDWPKFTVGGTLLEGNTQMVEFLAQGIALQSKALSLSN